ncbi:MAG: transcriptional repressor, partial [Lachnospiraceae bacterium]
MVKHSRQRDAILEYLRSTASHPTADTVYENVREKIPNISLGTVYRNLNMLAESGEVLRLSCGGTSDRYDGCVKPHYHFLCRSCGNVS